jgi:hypothetical protein
MQGSRMHGAIPAFPNTPSWCGTQLKHRDTDLDIHSLQIKIYCKVNDTTDIALLIVRNI